MIDADLEVGEHVEIIKNVENASLDCVGKTGVVDSRVSGGYKIKVTFPMIGSHSFVVGLIDWQNYVRRQVHKSPAATSLPSSLRSWYDQVTRTIKRGE